MKLSELIKKLQDLQKQKGDISIPNEAVKAIYMPLYYKKKNGDFELSIDYLKSIVNELDLFDYLCRELEIEPTKQGTKAYSKAYEAYSKAYDSQHRYGQEQVYFEFISLLDLLEVDYKKDWE